MPTPLSKLTEQDERLIRLWRRVLLALVTGLARHGLALAGVDARECQLPVPANDQRGRSAPRSPTNTEVRQ